MGWAPGTWTLDRDLEISPWDLDFRQGLESACCTVQEGDTVGWKTRVGGDDEEGCWRVAPPAPLRSNELLQSHLNKSSFVSHSRLIDLTNMTESRVDCSSVDSPGCAPTEQEFMTKPLIPFRLPRRCHGEGPCCGAATAKWRRPAGCQSHSGNGDFNSQASPSTTHRGVLAGPARTTP